MTERKILQLKRNCATRFNLLVTDSSHPYIIGTSDCDQKFHPFAIMICSGETSDNFAYLFEKVEEFNEEWKPKVLVADAAEAITARFIEVFGELELRIMCYFHVRKNMEEY